MNRLPVRRAGLVAGALLFGLSLPAAALEFNVHGLVTDDPGTFPASVTDAGLKNGWGLAYNPTGPFWISSNGLGTAVLYSVDPVTQSTAKLGLTVGVSGPDGITGQTFNPMNGSGAFNGNLFLFVSTDGSVKGWRGALGTTAETLVTPSTSNAYTGAAFGSAGGHGYLYAANFATGAIDVYKGDPGAPSLTGSFTDPNQPSNFAPFNVQTLGTDVLVAYAQRGADGDEVKGAGLGFVDRFDMQGNFMGRVASAGALNAPWGLAIAPASFGALAGDLLVGNFGDGRINIYAGDGSFLGQVMGANHAPVTIDGLWAIAPGNGGNAGSSSLLYFTAGPGDETHGAFGVLTPVPEPTTVLLMLAGLGAIAVLRRRG
jgi:uncharacterized protein (TIGR03118 family)